MSLPWQYPASTINRIRAISYLQGALADGRRRKPRPYLKILSCARKALPVRDKRSRLQMITTSRRGETECLTIAFYRFVELHGRVVSDPGSHCSLQTPLSGGSGRVQTRIVTLWSPRAAAEFERFWDCYWRVYGRGDDYARSAAA